MERTYSDLDDGAIFSAGCQFTVHNYTSGIASTARTPAHDLLNTGLKLIVSANLQTAGWIIREDFLTAPAKKSSTSYVFTSTPPSIVSRKGKGKAPSVYEIKEWGVLATEHEIFYLEDLEDFVNTDLSFLFAKSRPAPSRQHSGRNRPSPQSSEEPPAKRRKLDFGPLHSAIPQPHIHPSAFKTSYPPLKVIPYTKTRPILIPPLTDPLSPPSRHARSAWFVPVRGILPWDHCTIASILEISHHIPIPPTPANDEITWTRSSVEAFWSFLILLKNAGSVGSLGISFHASSSYRSLSSSTCEPSTYADAGNRTTAISSVSTHVRRVPLSFVDYIKVFHEAPKAMYVRTALDAWSYAVTDGDGSAKTGGKLKKIRVLKGAKLVLVDEQSRGILVS